MRVSFFIGRVRGAAKRIGGRGVVALAFAFAAILYGGSKPGQVQKVPAAANASASNAAALVVKPGVQHQESISPANVSLTASARSSLSASTIAETHVAHPFAGEPALVGKWWRRGAYDDGEIVKIPESAGWRFPWRGGHLARFEIWANGAVYASEQDEEPVARLRTPLSLRPLSSRVVHGFATNGAYRVEWRGAHPNRDHDIVADAAVELRRNGDVVLEEGGVATLVPYEIPFAHAGFGQDEAWVRANYADAADEILSAGYSNWVDEQVGEGMENGLYRFTATFSESPPEAIELRVGDFSVCVTNAGTYAFVLEKGVRYSFGTTPHVESVGYSYADDVPSARMALHAAATWQDGGRWTVGGGASFGSPTLSEPGEMLWMPTLRGSPDVVHVGPDDNPVDFWAVLSDVGPGADVGEFRWTATPPLELSATTGDSVTLRCESFPSWKESSITVSTRILGQELTSSLAFTYGVHDSPQAGIKAAVPSALLLRSDWIEDSRSAVARVVMTSDVETNGVVRVSVVSGSDKVSVGGSGLGDHRFDGAAEHSLSFPIDGVAVSAEVGDVSLVCEYLDAEGRVASSVSNRLTVVSPRRVAVNGDAVPDVAVLLGTSLSLEVVAEPAASAIPLVSWHDAKLRADRTYTGWRTWSASGHVVSRTMDESGVFAVKARALFPGPQWADVRYVWAEDEDQVTGFCHVGDDNHIGVASTQAQLDLRAAARARLGDTDYARSASLPARNGFSALKEKTWKCNAFVADVAIAAGLTVPAIHQGGIPLFNEKRYPPIANEWANGNVEIDGWEYLGKGTWPEPGLVVGHPAANESGHVGIVDFDGEGIAAGSVNVSRRYDEFLDGTSGFNKYVGNQEGQEGEGDE